MKFPEPIFVKEFYYTRVMQMDYRTKWNGVNSNELKIDVYIFLSCLLMYYLNEDKVKQRSIIIVGLLLVYM